MQILEGGPVCAGGITVPQVNSWFANKRNSTGNTRSIRKRQMLENGVLTLCEMLFRQQNPVAAAAANGVPLAASSATCATVLLLPPALPLRTFDSNGLHSNPSLTGTGAFAQGSTGFPFGALPFSLTAAAAAQGQQLLQPVWQSAFNQNTFNPFNPYNPYNPFNPYNHYNPFNPYNPYNLYNPFNALSVNQSNPGANIGNFLQNPFQNQNQQGSEATSTGSTPSFSGANSSFSTNSIIPWWSRQIPPFNFTSKFVPSFPQIPNTE